MHPTRQLVESAAHTAPGSKSVLMDFETVTKVVIRFEVELNALAKCTRTYIAERRERERDTRDGVSFASLDPQRKRDGH